jgi:hypothetical protein
MTCPRASGLTRRRTLAVVAAVAVVGAALVYLAMLTGLLPEPLEDAYSARGSLRNIYQALRRYDEVHGHLPLAVATDAKSGNAISWRIEIYQDIVAERGKAFFGSPSEPSLDYDRSKLWNAPDNLRLEGTGFWLFRTKRAPRKPSTRGIYATYFKAITGPGTAFDVGTPPSLKQLPKDLILIVKVEESDTHWMEPGDLRIDQLAPTEETRELLLSRDGHFHFIVLFADGAPWVLSYRTPISDLCKFFTVSGATRHDREQLLRPYAVLD